MHVGKHDVDKPRRLRCASSSSTGMSGSPDRRALDRHRKKPTVRAQAVTRKGIHPGLQARRHVRRPSTNRTRRTCIRRTRTSANRGRRIASKVIILGGGPNRIGQGIEFDYCCVPRRDGARAKLGIESIMINCNPETVSTDYDTSDRLYFEPLTLEDVLEICHVEKPWGVIVQFGGQTPLKLALPLAAAGVPILGTSADAIDRAEDRERFGEVMAKLQAPPRRAGASRGRSTRRGAVAAEIGFPVMVRPSYVLGGRAMERVYDARGLEEYFGRFLIAARGGSPGSADSANDESASGRLPAA